MGIIEKKDSELLRPTFKDAIATMDVYIKEGVTEESRDHARMTMALIGAYTRLRQVEAHEAGLKFAVNRALASSAEELQGYLKKSLPEFVVSGK